ncbi:hypothetical protein [Desulfatiglans anilini]|uniref:hypothetical protein n=1 Tax=Desulfatiglans anilini TaxID=90728 RepID=UPI0003F9A762|nr:hypothetical protein [Desulfatiglans anilini]
MKLLIAIDDTDNEESIGTGRLSRMLAASLREEGFSAQTTVTRHQLLLHPDIPYTSHNSSACIEMDVEGDVMLEAAETAKAFLMDHFHEGANPGLCVAYRSSVPDELQDLGFRAQREVLTIAEARALAARLGVWVWWLGETGQGCIGALSGVGLRSTGRDGRFISLEGIRDLDGRVSVGEILEKTGIQAVEDGTGLRLHAGEMVDSQGWLRPELKEGKPVLRVEAVNGAWTVTGKKKKGGRA